MHTNVDYFSCSEVEALGHFQLLKMRYNDRKVVKELRLRSRGSLRVVAMVLDTSL